jgi:hypothetical protein
MGLQEAQPHQITYLAKQCPEYAWYGLGRDTGEAPPKTETYASEECMAIFFQTSIVEMLDKGTFWQSECMCLNKKTNVKELCWMKPVKR